MATNLQSSVSTFPHVTGILMPSNTPSCLPSSYQTGADPGILKGGDFLKKGHLYSGKFALQINKGGGGGGGVGPDPLDPTPGSAPESKGPRAASAKSSHPKREPTHSLCMTKFSHNSQQKQLAKTACKSLFVKYL